MYIPVLFVYIVYADKSDLSDPTLCFWGIFSCYADFVLSEWSYNCKFGNFCEGFSFTKVKPSLNGEITLWLTDVSKSCPIVAIF